MSSRYIIRLDDACPTMDARKWRVLEDQLDSLGICPLVAVVPDNRDPVLEENEPDPDFWNRVRAWQAKGWTIAMHGFQHAFHVVNRKRLLLPFYDRSEFGGLSYADQASKIRNSWHLFKDQCIEPTVWIAPAHCFDRVTVKALRDETPIRIISDGIAYDQFYEDGFYWLPQQLWRMKEKAAGLWTVCLHPNMMTNDEISALGALLGREYCGKVVSVADIPLLKRSKSIGDKFFAIYFWQHFRSINLLVRFKSFWGSA